MRNCLQYDGAGRSRRTRGIRFGTERKQEYYGPGRAKVVNRCVGRYGRDIAAQGGTGRHWAGLVGTGRNAASRALHCNSGRHRAELGGTGRFKTSRADQDGAILHSGAILYRKANGSPCDCSRISILRHIELPCHGMVKKGDIRR